MIESTIEKRLTREITKLGGMSLKWVSPGNKGVPDRIVIYKGRIMFVELKKPKGVLSDSQKLMHKKLLRQNIYVFVISTNEELDVFLNGIQK